MLEMAGASSPGSSAVPEPAWQALRSLDPQVEDQIVTLATCLALAEQRFQLLFEDVLPRFAQTPEDLTGELVAEAAKQGDAVGLQAYREAGEWLGLAAASVVNLVNPGVGVEPDRAGARASG